MDLKPVSMDIIAGFRVWLIILCLQEIKSVAIAVLHQHQVDNIKNHEETHKGLPDYL